jgi:hypothetical protein
VLLRLEAVGGFCASRAPAALLPLTPLIFPPSLLAPAPDRNVQGGAPDVVYAYTPGADLAVDISTCGSLFDTKLYIFDDPANLQVWGG